MGAFGLGIITLGVLVYVYTSLAQRFPLDGLAKMPTRSRVLDAMGQEIGRLHGENRITVPLSEISPLFIQAILAREDDRFYTHNGIDWFGLGRATLRNLKDKGASQGASTITMQVARNAFPGLTAKNLHRKLLEAALARRLEANFTKDQILEAYLNRIFFGSGLFGVERAAQAYFGCTAKALTLDQSAMLAAIIRGPNKFSPFRHYEIALSGRNMVLGRMVAENRLTQPEADAAMAVPTRVLPEPQAGVQETWAMDAVRRDLDRLLDDQDAEDGGLTITTTLDVELQSTMEASIAQRLAEIEKTRGYEHETRAQYHARAERVGAQSPPPEPEYLQAAGIVIENFTGAVRAVVGGRDYHDSSFNRALLSQRQIGSTFKPFVYAAAVEHGLTPVTLINDDP
jgi:penicillin-binding protein 1A